MSLTVKILSAMAAGLILGLFFQGLSISPDNYFQTYILDGLIDSVGQIFIVSLKMVVVPLVFISLTCGAASLGASGSIGRLGGKTIGLYLLTTAIAVSSALLIALLVNPGMGASVDTVLSVNYVPKDPPSVKETLIAVFPDNPIAAMAEGKMLQVIVFALFLGLAISKSGENGKDILLSLDKINQVLMKLIMLIVSFAPYGVFALMVKLGLTVGVDEISKLAAYFFTVVGVLILHGLLVYPTLLFIFARVNPVVFLLKMREAVMVAFSTSSSGATMPVTMKTVEERLGVNAKVSSFAVPLGATINMDGTAIMQGVATVFIAQFYGITLSPDQFLMVILTATLASIGTAAVPGVGLVMLTMVLGQVGLPVEGIGLIIGVDRLLDMLRTAVNVTGDGTVATIVAATEGELDKERFDK
ncbi:MAG: dicarboxylate/amino acid:cation symporter [Betaproteobacteria bacterium TMED82]|nr:MAG: dicarboxylate/amino acid:cation symporter [Betaproteobacteria bacterium TMED82]|tara:strand:+ start:13785 stop:15029 length:1245 start_codon:yes stop_codon:yes gene_type:complete